MSLDSSPSEGDSEDHVSTSSDSSGASTLATDQEDVFGLISNAGLPLNEALEPYSSNGWPLQPPITEPEDWDGDSPYQSIVNVLRHEATLPLRQLLPPGYHPITSSALEMNGSDDTSIRRRQPQRRPNRLALVNGCSPHDETVDAVVDGLVDDDVDREDEVRSETSAEAEPMELDGYPSDSEVSAASSMTTAAHFWNSVTDAAATPLVPSASPGELARRARGLSQWRTQVPSRRALHSRLPAFGPTCRVPFLPTSSLRECMDSVYFCRCSGNHQVGILAFDEFS
ncbi:unnamed protein product [Hydatigera taeniaeformis]|uniref:Uncharacterized protein n=1 Tax=Hydatigena taeniaeformis TaxID=6205 RepID=A0A0R3WXM5_HYDTA|nr:unnamed protein product [Hydatigera taeniaeformis]